MLVMSLQWVAMSPSRGAPIAEYVRYAALSSASTVVLSSTRDRWRRLAAVARLDGLSDDEF